MKKRFIFIAVAIVLIAVFLFMLVNHKPKSDNGDLDSNQYNLSDNQLGNQNNQGPENAGSRENEDENCNVSFSEYLIDPKYVQKVGQVGVVHGSGQYIVERSYISIKQEFKEQNIPIYAPGDMKFIAGARYKVSPDPNYLTDYVVKFDAGCKTEILLGHLKEVVNSIGDQLIGTKNTSAEDYVNPVEFKAGELIGYYYQQSQNGVSGFDFVVRDRKIINQFINQERYSDGRADNLISGVCPYDYFVQEKKQAYYNLLGGAGGTVFKVKDCGTSSRDKAGTISGMWFLDKEIVGWIYQSYKDGDYGSPLSISGDEERINIGNLGNQNVQWVYADNPTYKLPTDITSEHCYQFYPNLNTPSGYVYLKVIDERTMDAYYSLDGKCPSSMPSGGKRYYK